MKIRDLKKWHIVLFEVGMIFSLLIFIAAFTTKFKTDPPKSVIIEPDPDPVKLKHVPIIKEKRPTPPKPRVFQPVPNHTPIDDLPDLSDIAWEPEDFIPYPDMKKKGAEDDEPVPFVKAEKKPLLVGGKESLYQKISYPKRAKLAGIEGWVTVEFTVDSKGNIKNPVVTRGIGAGCDQEVIDALIQSKFKAGMQRGIYVPVRMKVSVVFRLR